MRRASSVLLVFAQLLVVGTFTAPSLKAPGMKVSSPKVAYDTTWDPTKPPCPDGQVCVPVQ